MRQQVVDPKSSSPSVPLSHAIVAEGRFAFLCGQGPINPETGRAELGSFTEQPQLTLENIGRVLQAANTSWDQVVKVNVFLADLADFPALNQIYQNYLKFPYPARTTVRADLIGGIAIEVECIAVVP